MPAQLGAVRSDLRALGKAVQRLCAQLDAPPAPPQLAALAQRLVAGSADVRSAADVLQASLFRTHPLVLTLAALDELRMQEDPQRPAFFQYALSTKAQRAAAAPSLTSRDPRSSTFGCRGL